MKQKSTIIAMYLPQFHRVPDNDKWWGEGFTDWVSAKNAKPLFEGHNQPHIPLNENYYDLLQKKTMKWQAQLMHQYGVDGMCIYHYWFKDGRQILEKPAENLLNWKDIDMPFCFCWANETWARSWSNLSEKNAWADAYEKNSGEETGILLEQKYGTEIDWEKHFNYLLSFFKDSRYIKVDNKPLFLIYKTSKISRIDAMLVFWNELALRNGLDGIYCIGANASNVPDEVLDGKLVIEPSASIGNTLGDTSDGVKTVQYKDLWDNVLSYQEIGGKVYYGGFVGFDDTPRRGKRGTCVTNGSPELFKKYLLQLLKKNILCGNEITFINAWNEWGEGMHLEPSVRDSYSYLEKMLEAKKEIENVSIEYELKMPEIIPKDTLYFRTLHHWFELKEKNISLNNYFKENIFRKIAVYGYGIFAQHLMEELRDSETIVEYIIDKRDGICAKKPVYLPQDPLPDVDAVIVCSFYYYKEIFLELKKKGMDNVISFETIINELR
ncbi:MAG: glycoside hydrolase family 99-like domain-containing protein [Lachnospiraceae bacterium]|nr:glycoside hydrolase family 99-like domain-containing protein [Lachnospiraceae bacterium]